MPQDLSCLCYADCPILAEPNNSENENENKMIVGEYSVSICNAIGFIKHQGSFTMEKFDALDQGTQKEVAQSLA